MVNQDRGTGAGGRGGKKKKLKARLRVYGAEARVRAAHTCEIHVGGVVLVCEGTATLV